MSDYPKEHNELYFDALCRSQKKETILALIEATYYSKKYNSDKTKVREEIAKRLIHGYGLLKKEIGTYLGEIDQFTSQYTIGHEMGIWRNSDLDLSLLAQLVAENKITIVKYLDIVFLNYTQRVGGKVIHPLINILKYLLDKDIKEFSKDEIPSMVNCPIDDENANMLSNFLCDTSYFYYGDRHKIYFNSEDYNISDLINKCNKKLLGENGIEIINEELNTSERYLRYLFTNDENIIKLNLRLEYLLQLGPTEFIDGAIDILKEYMSEDLLEMLCDKSKMDSYYKASYSILVKEENIETIDTARYSTKNRIKINNQYYIPTNDWYDDEKKTFGNKKLFVKFIKKYINNVDNKTNKDIEKSLTEDRNVGGFNKIIYGVPGTGKSFQIDTELEKEKEENKFRVTFHPDFSYNDFIGQLLPTVNNETGEITYDFKPGQFTVALKRAYENSHENIYLIIEEMSRGNCAAIFGDIFQLLDRNKEGNEKDWSTYSINNEIISNEIINNKTPKIKIPSNMYIYGTVNTSDQNVFVMDTAFKRRFEWTYVSTKPIEKDGKYINNIDIDIINDEENLKISWVKFYQKLNYFISSKEKLDLGEDKQIGQFFILFDEDSKKNKDKIRDKLLHYLWFDIQNASYKDGIKLFKNEISNYSDLYDSFKEDKKIFGDTFIELLKN